MTPSVSSLKEEVWAQFMWILFIPKLRLLITALSLFSGNSEEQRPLYAAFCARTICLKNTYHVVRTKIPNSKNALKTHVALKTGIYRSSQSVWWKSKSSCLSSMPGWGQLFTVITYSAFFSQRAQHQQWSPCLCLQTLRQPAPLCIFWPSLNYLNIARCHKTDTVLLHVSWHIKLHWRHLLVGGGRGDDDAAKTAAEREITVWNCLQKQPGSLQGLMEHFVVIFVATEAKMLTRTPSGRVPGLCLRRLKGKCGTRPERTAVFVATKETRSVPKLVRVEPPRIELTCEEIFTFNI